MKFAWSTMRFALATICLISFALLPTGVPEARTQSRAPQEMSEIVNQAIKLSQQRYGVNVDEAAQIVIRNAFAGQGASLQEIFQRLRLNPKEQKWLLSSLVEEYICDLRDIQKGWMPNSSLAQERSQAKLVPSAFSTQISGVGAAVKIAAEAANRYSVADFLARLQKVLNGPKPGRLEVVSNPDGASIRLDHDDAGQTCKTFVVSPGEHAVSVEDGKNNLHCSGQVRVGEGETKRFCCPTGSNCPTWKNDRGCVSY
jgi:hypothetical protein